MPIDSHHPQYDKNITLQTKSRHAVEGEEVIKDRGTLYLPRLIGQEQDEYDAYKSRAMYYNASARTVEGLSGAILRKEPVIEYPDILKEQLKTIGIANQPFSRITSDAVAEAISIGRYGLLVDAPALIEDVAADGTITYQDVEPYIASYYAEDILNWKEEKLGDRLRKTLVVLREMNAIPGGDMFEDELEEQFRVLLLQPMVDELTGEVSMTYTAQVWRKREEKEGSNVKVVWEPVTPLMIPRKRGGKTFDEIPFVFVNPNGTDSEIEAPPILDLVNVNISHYKTSADLEHGRHFTALPTAVLTGASSSERTGVRKIGSSTAWEIEEPQAKAFFLEFTGAGLKSLSEALVEKERLMAVLGARLLEEQKSGIEAAETVKLRQAGEQSVLAKIALSCSEALTKVLQWVAMWSGQQDVSKISVALNTDFNVMGIDAVTMKGMQDSVVGGLMSWDVFFYNLQKGEVYPEGHTAEQEKALIALGGPMLTPEEDEPEPAPKKPETKPAPKKPETKPAPKKPETKPEA